MYYEKMHFAQYYAHLLFCTSTVTPDSQMYKLP